MSVGIISSRFRRRSGSPVTYIDGLPVVFKAGRTAFVDGTLGSNGDGSSFANAYYTESVVAANDLRGLSLIGTGNGKGGSVYQACTWRNSSNSVDDSALDL